MTVGELKELLSDLDDGWEVQLQTQQNWPFINDIHGLILKSQIVSEDKDEDDEDNNEKDDGPEIVYIVEGSQLEYGDKGAWR
jgi:hypothetical protein